MNRPFSLILLNGKIVAVDERFTITPPAANISRRRLRSGCGLLVEAAGAVNVGG